MNNLYTLFAIAGAVFLLQWAWKILNWAWFKPRKAEKWLREQGLVGTSYRILLGDVKEMVQMGAEATAKPLHFTNDIVSTVMPFVHKIMKNYGENSFLWAGPSPTLLIMDSQLIKEVLSSNYVYQKLPGNSVSYLLAKGLSSYETHKWSKHRRLMNPAFHLEKLKLMLPGFDLSCREMLRKWEKIVPSEGSCELDVWPYLRTMTSDVISRTAFGSNYEEGRKIFELQDHLAQLVGKALLSVYVPGMRFLPTKGNRKMKAIAKEIRSSVLSIINKRVKAMQAGQPNADDLLGLLLESNFQEINQHESKKFGMSFEEVIEECKLFYFAGQETTAALLVWTLILLGKHSDWQDRARDEVLQIFGHNKPDLEELNHLKVVNMILNEVLRLYPPVVVIRRMVHEETKLGKLSLPAGAQVFLPVILLHHEETIWGADAKEFNPERFSEGILKATKGQHVFFPFSSGPRICIGQNFAMLEAKMALALILQRFSFELSPSYAHAPNTTLILQPQLGAQLMVSKVQREN